MSTIIVITPPPKRENRTTEETEDTVIKVKLEGEGSVADLLREAADHLDGNA